MRANVSIGITRPPTRTGSRLKPSISNPEACLWGVIFEITQITSTRLMSQGIDFFTKSRGVSQNWLDASQTEEPCQKRLVHKKYTVSANWDSAPLGGWSSYRCYQSRIGKKSCPRSATGDSCRSAFPDLRGGKDPAVELGSRRFLANQSPAHTPGLNSTDVLHN